MLTTQDVALKIIREYHPVQYHILKHGDNYTVNMRDVRDYYRSLSGDVEYLLEQCIEEDVLIIPLIFQICEVIDRSLNDQKLYFALLDDIMDVIGVHHLDRYRKSLHTVLLPDLSNIVIQYLFNKPND